MTYGCRVTHPKGRIMTTDENLAAAGGGVGRRALIKGAAVAGVAAWTAPVLIDSLTSPAAAAACSTRPTISFKTSLNGNGDTPLATWTTPSFTANAGSTLVVYIATSNQTVI